jgi:NADH-quinone oxidoreductase subunit M
MVFYLISFLGVGLLGLFIIPFSHRHLYRPFTLGVSCIAFLISLLIWICFDLSTSKFQYVIQGPIPIGVDGISLFFILLVTFLFPLCLISAWEQLGEKGYGLCLLSIELFLVLVFSVLDLLWFYIFFETVLIPIFMLIGIWGSRRRKIRAAYMFFVYTLVGSLLMLASLIYIYTRVGTLEYTEVLSFPFTFVEERWLWLGFFASFATKVPMLPIHIWLPEAHVEAPTTGSVLLAGILLKLGTYGIIRFSLPLFPQASLYFTPLVFTIAAVGVLYPAITAIRQTDLKRIIAYASVSHINLVVIGLFSWNFPGLEGSILQSLSHGLVASALFLLVGVVYDRYHTRLVKYYGGLVHSMPLFSLLFLFFTMANIGLPGTSNFVGEFLLLLGSFQASTIGGLIGGTGIVLGGAYSLWVFNRIVYGNVKLQYLQKFTDVNFLDLCVLTPLVIGTLWIGLYPQSFFQYIQPSLTLMLL